MRTKHLFFATALMASLAACTNENIADVQQGNSAVERPAVENVKLNFVGGAESRLTFNGGWAWSATDSIGALLMDTPNSTDKNAKWTDRYTLQSYVNTSYPFTYNAADETWGCPGKMLEGNYFFAFPWSSYDGGRFVKHSLINQAQNGVSEAAKYESYADNQFFIGYSQIKKGTAFDVLEDIEMTSVLGAIQVKIVNNGSKTYHINKIQLNGSDVVSELTFNPTNAKYGVKTDDDAFNTHSSWFNFAYYTGNDQATEWVYDEDAEIMEEYNRAEALRAVVNKSGTGAVAQLDVTGAADERAIAKGATGYVVIMTQSVAKVADLSLTIYTDEGVIKNIDLDKVTAKTGVTYAPAIEKIAPDVANTVVVKFEDSALESLNSLEIHTEGDLLQLLGWNENVDLATKVTATLKADVEFTKEMYDIVKANKLIDLIVSGSDYELTLDENIPANIFEDKQITLSVGKIVAENDIELTKKSACTAQLTIAEGATLTIDSKDDAFFANVVNEGTIEVEAVKFDLKNVKNFGVINVAEGADIKNIVNYGVVNNNGYLQTVTNNDTWTNEEGKVVEVEAIINLAEGAVLKGLTNDAVVNAAKNSRIGGTNNGLIACADNTIVFETGFTNNLMIALAVEDTNITEKQYTNTKINTLILNGVATVKHANTGIDYLIAMEGAELKADNKVAASFKGLIVEGDATLTSVLTGDNASSITFTEDLVVEEGATLVNNANVYVKTSIENDGLIKNNAAVTVKTNGYTEGKNGEWMYNNYTEDNFVVKSEVKYTLTVADGQTIKAAKAAKETDTANHTYTIEKVVIEGTLDMSLKDNKDNVSVLNNKVELNGSITNLTNAMGATISELTITGNSVISGSKNMVLVTVGKLNVVGKTLKIKDGFVKVSEQATKDLGTEKVNVTGYVDGNIIGFDADGVMLYLNYQENKWQADPFIAEMTDVSITAGTAEEVKWALENNIEDFVLEGEIEVDEAIEMNCGDVLNMAGATLKAEEGAALVKQVGGAQSMDIIGGKIEAETGILSKSATDADFIYMKEVTFEGKYLVEHKGHATVLVLDNCDLKLEKNGKIVGGNNVTEGHAVQVYVYNLKVNGIPVTSNAYLKTFLPEGCSIYNVLTKEDLDAILNS